MRLNYYTTLLFSVMAFCVFVTGCTHLTPIAVQPSEFPPTEKIPAKVVLVLNKEFSEFTHQQKMLGDTFIFPLGPALTDYARHVADACFQEVSDSSSLPASSPDTSAGILLVPRAVKAAESQGWRAGDDANFTLVVEWTALDRSRNTIWLKTITANATDKAGPVTGKHHRALMQKTFDDLSAKTRAAFESASELRIPSPQ